MKYFTIKELCKSRSAELRKIDNTPNKEETRALVELVDNVLDPLREKFGKPIVVTSGFRCAKLNRSIGGSTSSEHMKGEAADIVSEDGDKLKNYQLGVMLYSGFSYGQLIFENVNVSQKTCDWIHVSYSARHSNRHQTLKKLKNSNSYTIFRP
jgi:zinc D-Ala-D-Ala carboxypeptidase